MKIALRTAVALLLVMQLAYSASAAEQPFHAEGVGVVDFPKPKSRTLVVEQGHATSLGNFRALFDIKIKGQTSFSEIVFQGANGDALYLLAVTNPDATLPGQRGEYVITGGTGRFADASGGGDLVFEIVEFVDGDAIGVLTLDGAIDY